MKPFEGSVRVVGHPFGPLGISRAARVSLASFRAAGIDAKIIDVYGRTEPDAVHAVTLADHRVSDFGDFNLFHLNGDEIEPALAHLGGLRPKSRNAVCPMWELPRYPEHWAHELERFDEVWAATKFIADAIAPAVRNRVVHVPLATQITPLITRSRRYFGIPDAAYAFLFFFDLRSYVERKNPDAVIEAFRSFLDRRPWSQACLVIKVHGGQNAPDATSRLADSIAPLGSRVRLINAEMREDEAHSLIDCCDAFVSLHRAEGYGLGLAEAMFLGKPVIGTAYSGNMDFMNSAVAHLVDFKLVDVPIGAYPHWQGQTWADPDVNQAAHLMTKLYDDPEAGRALGRSAATHMQAHFSFRAAGLRYVAAIEGNPGTRT